MRDDDCLPALGGSLAPYVGVPVTAVALEVSGLVDAVTIRYPSADTAE